ncbi:MAG: methylmalonyl Co-A mutase-associated GTPase MeaB [bacterium]|nr:methylmalonyl Co-A mutase-associated GTPase MeaB [bacterium]
MESHNIPSNDPVIALDVCRTLAKTLTALDRNPDNAAETLRSCPLMDRPKTGKIIGVTGPESVGKSTLISSLITTLRKSGKTVAVLAIDPSSSINGGAFLGDRTRMQSHAIDRGVFIRSIATKNASAGLAPAARSMLELMAHVADAVIVETTGAGQTDSGIADLCQTLVLMPSPKGDEVSIMKSGVKEHAHLLVVNTRQSEAPICEHFTQQLRMEWEGGLLPDGWRRKIFSVDALYGRGVDELVRDGILAHWTHLDAATVK